MMSWGTKAIFIIAAIVVVGLIVLTGCAWDNSEPASIIENITATVTCLTASMSLIFTSIIRDEGKKRHSNDRKVEEELKWYQALVLDRYLQRLIGFFDDCQRLVDVFAEVNLKRGELNGNEYDELVKREVLLPFTEKYTAIHRDIVTDTQIIDSALSTTISKSFSDFQDSFSEYTDMQNPNYDKMKRDIKEQYASIIKTIMKYSNDIVSNKK